MQPEDQQQPADDKPVNRGVMRIGQRCGEHLSDEKGFVFGSPFGTAFAGGNATPVDDAAATDSDASA